MSYWLHAFGGNDQTPAVEDSLFNHKKRLGLLSQPLNCLWIVEQDAVVEPYSTVRRWNDEIEF